MAGLNGEPKDFYIVENKNDVYPYNGRVLVNTD